MSSPTSNTVTFFWRPGCPFCGHLERHLVANDVELEYRNIWDDPEAAAFVRSVANGNETVPTVTVGQTSMVNPTIDQVLEALSSVTSPGASAP